MTSREVTLLQKRLERLEATVKRITQIETKPRLIIPTGGGGAEIEGTLDSLEVAGSSSPYAGLTIATITVEVAPCDRDILIGTQVEVVDHSGCVFDLTEEQLANVWVWAGEKIALSLASGATEGELTPCHWSANDRCCVAADVGA